MEHDVDFFDPKYIPVSENIHCCKKFCICDSSSGAYTMESEHGACIVVNEQNKKLQFVPVDKNIHLLNENGELLKSCDGMLYNAADRYEFIIFIELKSGMSIRNWRSDAINQLLSTVKIFIHNHDASRYNKKLCYASNAVHQIVRTIHQDELEDFAKHTNGFMLKIHYKVEV